METNRITIGYMIQNPNHILYSNRFVALLPREVVGRYVLRVDVATTAGVAPAAAAAGGPPPPPPTRPAAMAAAAAAGAGQPERDGDGDGSGDNGSWPNCKQCKPCTIETSWNNDDPGRRFYRCPHFTSASKDGGFTQWMDEKFPKAATRHIKSFQDTIESLELQVDNLQNELDELRRRRRRRKRSSAGTGGGGDRSTCDGAQPSGGPRLSLTRGRLSREDCSLSA